CACDAWSIDAARDGRLMVGAAGAIHVSHDRGDRWRRTAVTGRVVGVACDPGQPRHMFAAIEPHGVWHSDDGGARFAPVATMPEPRGVAVAGPGTIAVGATGALRGAPGGPFAVAADQACHAVAVALDAPDLVFVGAERALLRSRTEVLHLQAVELPAPLAGPVTAVALAPGDRCRIAAVTARGQLVYSVDCCTHWHITQLPAHAAPAHALAIT
ncbi:MAG TPA: hypothetical protein VFP84_11445, partial [Kofleriaceae bacterium]|nr:hypothetical protein [Kofleriaceae bacterium]